MAKKVINQDILDQWEEMHKKEILSVKHLAEKIGYGNLMSLASALWHLKLTEHPKLGSGAFIPTLPGEMKKKDGKKASEEQNRRAKSIKKILSK